VFKKTFQFSEVACACLRLLRGRRDGLNDLSIENTKTHTHAACPQLSTTATSTCPNWTWPPLSAQQREAAAVRQPFFEAHLPASRLRRTAKAPAKRQAHSGLKQRLPKRKSNSSTTTTITTTTTVANITAAAQRTSRQRPPSAARRARRPVRLEQPNEQRFCFFFVSQKFEICFMLLPEHCDGAVRRRGRAPQRHRRNTLCRHGPKCPWKCRRGRGAADQRVVQRDCRVGRRPVGAVAYADRLHGLAVVAVDLSVNGSAGPFVIGSDPEHRCDYYFSFIYLFNQKNDG